jgi:hypothetical protein
LTLQNTTQAKRNYGLNKIFLGEQEWLKTSKKELNEAKAIENEETINARNREFEKIAAERPHV